jgi:hypothetical protein
MTRDDIIKMAIEARLPHYWESGDEIVYIDRVTHFAKLVAQHTLANIDPSKFMSYQEGVEAGRLAEREACAQVCEDNATDLSEGDWDSACTNCSYLIRARGNP